MKNEGQHDPTISSVYKRNQCIIVCTSVLFPANTGSRYVYPFHTEPIFRADMLTFYGWVKKSQTNNSRSNLKA